MTKTNKISRYLLCVAFFTLQLLCLTSSAQTVHFYTSDKLSSNQITRICQDKVGYIWVGTEYGLNKYDGYRFTNYLHETDDTTSVCSNVISFLFADSKGTVWVGTQKGLDRYDDVNDRFEHIPLRGATQVPRINHMIQEDEDHLLIGTAGYGLFRLDIRNNQSQKLNDYATSDNNYFSHIIIDSEGAFWKSGQGNSIVRRSPKGELEEFTSPYGTVTDFVEYEGGVLMVCIHGLLYYRDGEIKTDFIDMGSFNGKDLFFRVAMKDRKGNLFVVDVAAEHLFTTLEELVVFLRPLSVHVFHRLLLVGSFVVQPGGRLGDCS